MLRYSLGVGLSPVLVMVMLCLCACAAGGGARGRAGSDDPARRIVGTWTLRTLSDREVASLLKPGPGERAIVPSLEFRADGGVSGFGGVNRIAGTVEPSQLARGELDLTRLVSTKMAGPQMQLENEYLQALARATRFSFTKDGELQLHDGATQLMTFARGGE